MVGEVFILRSALCVFSVLFLPVRKGTTIAGESSVQFSFEAFGGKGRGDVRFTGQVTQGYVVVVVVVGGGGGGSLSRGVVFVGGETSRLL